MIIKTKRKINKIKAFSIAEMLIVFMIVALIALLSVPIAKKKVKKETKIHGKIVCTLNSNGEHIMWKKGLSGTADNPSSWAVTKEKTKCIMDIPLKVRNVTITAIGGGGGGSAAAKEYKKWTGDGIIPIQYPGTYRMAAIGSGGAGGVAQCDLNALGNKGEHFSKAGGGGAGGIALAEFEITEDTTQLELHTGKGHNNTSTHNPGENGEESYIKRQYLGGSEYIIRSYGGRGGQGNKRQCGNWDKERRKNDGTGARGGSKGGFEYLAASNLYKQKKNYDEDYTGAKDHCSSYDGQGRTYKKCYGYYNYLFSFNSFLDPNSRIGETYKFIDETNIDKQPGRGGNTGSGNTTWQKCSKFDDYCGGHEYYQSHKPEITQANDGLVVVSTTYQYTGEGGKAPVIGQFLDQQFVPSLKKSKLEVTIGSGGLGGLQGENANIDGQDGKPTLIDDLYVLPGGKGGKAKYHTYASFDKIAGENGAQTPLYYKKSKPKAALGGYVESNDSPSGQTAAGYGGGGGGGGTSTSIYEGKEGAGLGGNGAPGIVIIEW